MIRWITERLGTAPFGDPEITVDIKVVDVRDLVDKQGNVPEVIREKIDHSAALLQQGHRLVICCDYGISRSNAIAAGVLCAIEHISLESAMRQVMQVTGEQEIKLGPLEVVRMALCGGHDVSTHAQPRILMTGGSGFIGMRLQAALGANIFRCAPSRHEINLAEGALALDLLVREHGINCIIHLANPRVYTSVRALGESLTMLRNVLEVCRHNGVRLIYPSGWEVYSGYRASNLLADESMPALPKGPYGEAKYLCEQLIGMHRAHHGLKCTVLRSSPLYGLGGDRPKFIYNFLEKARRHETIYTHSYINGAPSLDLLSVDDFIVAVLGLVRNPFDGALNIGSGQLVSTHDVARWIVDRCGSRSEVVFRDIDEYAPNVAMDYDLAESVLGWRPKISWQEGLDGILEECMNGDYFRGNNG